MSANEDLALQNYKKALSDDNATMEQMKESELGVEGWAAWKPLEDKDAGVDPESEKQEFFDFYDACETAEEDVQNQAADLAKKDIETRTKLEEFPED